MDKLWLGSTTREFDFKMEKVLFPKRFGPTSDDVSQFGQEVQCQVFEKERKGKKNPLR